MTVLEVPMKQIELEAWVLTRFSVEGDYPEIRSLLKRGVENTLMKGTKNYIYRETI